MKAKHKTILTLLAISSVLTGSLMAQARRAVTVAPAARSAVTPVRPAVNPTFRGDIVVGRGPVVHPTPRHDPLGRIEAARLKAARIKAAREDAANNERGPNVRRRPAGN